jgi:hypothetical protein
MKGENVMDKENVVKAFDKFEREKFTDSEDILRAEIRQAVNDHLKDKLGLKKDPIVQKSAE